jgi:hypothetical protein
MSFSRAIRRRTFAGDRQKVRVAIEAEMGGVHLSTWISCPSRWRCRPTKVKPLRTDRRRDLRPLGQPRHVQLQAQHAVVEHVLAAEAQHRPGSPVAPYDRGRDGVDQIDRIGHLIEHGLGRGSALGDVTACIQSMLKPAWYPDSGISAGTPGPAAVM